MSWPWYQPCGGTLPTISPVPQLPGDTSPSALAELARQVNILTELSGQTARWIKTHEQWNNESNAAQLNWNQIVTEELRAINQRLGM